MKVLIVGKDSYIGNHIDEWLKKHKHKVTQLDVLNDSWREYDYSSFDSIIHVAGIVHRPNCQDWELYKKVNADMPVAIANIAKTQGVRQYIFLSSMGIYGKKKELHSNIIDIDTIPSPNSMYGRSKLMAEEGLKKLQDKNFNVVCIRPPSVYGKGCKGGYISGFASIVRKIPFIPIAYENVKQSFLYVENLAELVRILLERRWSGTFCPQDDKAVSANELLKAIANGMGVKKHGSRVLGYCVHLLSFLSIVKKAYGGIEYSKSLSTFNSINYVVVPFEEGMRRALM